MDDQGKRQPGIAGDSDHEQHRAGPGEGVRAPFIADGGTVSEMSVFDGKGNESVVRLTTDAEGNTAQGTGPSSEAAGADAESLMKKARRSIGDAFGPVHKK
jgi:hypothetical protein